jgi:hypothetical protein
MPFSRNVVLYGEPFPIDERDLDEEAQERIGAALDEATREADRAAGITPPEIWTLPADR